MHPQVYETWFSHLQIPRYLIACVMIQDTRRGAFYRAKTAPMVFGCAMFSQPLRWKGVGYPLCWAKPY